jgi:acetyltransferase
MVSGGLDAIFSPRSIAVVGASRHRGKVGYAIMHNLIVNEFQGTVYPVNPNATSVHGVRAYPSVLDIPDPVDLAIVTVPAEAALEAVEACGRKGVRGLVVITAGFREIGGPGVEREARLLELCREHGMTMIGPNCMGVINTNPDVRMDATFAPTPPLRGTISFMTQSGALGVAILDHAKSINVGFAKFASLGNKAQVSGNDLLEAWSADPETATILMYIENFGNPKNFVRIARDVTKRKPIIAVKSGRSEAGSRAAVSHTGSLGGSDLAADAVFNQTGVLRANSIEELFDDAMAFSLQPLPRGPRVAVVTDAGGPGIMCVDELIAQGLRLAELDPRTVASMRAWAAPEAALGNPVDLIASATAEDYERAMDAVLADPGVDACIAVYVPPVVTDEVRVARAIWTAAKRHDKTVLCTFLGRSEESPGFVELVQNGIPSYLFPESAARALAAMHRRTMYLARPEGAVRRFDVDRVRVGTILSGRPPGSRLPEADAGRLLEAYGMSVATSEVCDGPGAAAKAAARIGFPVVLKTLGPELVHKTDLKAVALDLRDGASVRTEATRMAKRLGTRGLAVDGFLVQEFVRGGKEVILGMTRDKVFGPLIVFGLGGVYVEYLKDVAFGIPPLTDEDARRMIRSIRTYPLLEGVRGEEPSDVAALTEALERFSQMVLDLDRVDEIDLNPVIVLGKGAGYRVVDARIVLGPSG